VRREVAIGAPRPIQVRPAGGRAGRSAQVSGWSCARRLPCRIQKYRHADEHHL